MNDGKIALLMNKLRGATYDLVQAKIEEHEATRRAERAHDALVAVQAELVEALRDVAPG